MNEREDLDVGHETVEWRAGNVERPSPLDLLDQPRAVDLPAVSGSPEHLQVRLPNHGEFARSRSSALEAGDYEPGVLRVEGARGPWADSARCAEPWRYIDVPSAQRAVEEQFGRNGITNETLYRVNPVDPRNHLRDNNCAETTRAVASLLDGQPYAARPMRPGLAGTGEDPAEMERWAGRADMERHRHGPMRMTASQLDAAAGTTLPEVEAGFVELERELRIAGPGAHAAVAAWWRPERPEGGWADPSTPLGDAGGHWFNAANIDGRIVYIDVQRRARRHDDVVCAAAESTIVEHEYRRAAMSMSWLRTDRRAP